VFRCFEIEKKEKEEEEKKWLSLAEGRPQKRRSKAKRFCAPISRETSFSVKLP